MGRNYGSLKFVDIPSFTWESNSFDIFIWLLYITISIVLDDRKQW